MPSLSIASRRQVLAMGRMATRRFQSTTAEKATEQGQNAVNKAAEGLSRATSAAGPAIANAAKGISGAMGRIGGRTAKLAAFVEKQVPKVIYYSKVGAELAKIVFQGQKMTPPPLDTFQNYFRNVLNNPRSVLQSVQQTAAQGAQSTTSAVKSATSAVKSGSSFPRTKIAAAAVVVVECLGFFTVGEMLGRMKIIGYHGEVPSAHH